MVRCLFLVDASGHSRHSPRSPYRATDTARSAVPTQGRRIIAPIGCVSLPTRPTGVPMNHRTAFPLAAVVFALTACADDPVQPTPAPMADASMAMNSAAPGQVVEFNGPVRSDFADRVTALGGTVDFVVNNAGFARVSGLSPQAISALGKHAGIGAV